MKTATASGERDRQLDHLELLIATLVLGSVAGALINAATTGRRYGVGGWRTAGTC